jgi:hypothetical protein
MVQLFASCIKNLTAHMRGAITAVDSSIFINMALIFTKIMLMWKQNCIFCFVAYDRSTGNLNFDQQIIFCML